MLRPKCSPSRWGSSALRGTIIIEQRPAIVGLCFTRKFTYRNFTSKNHHQSLWLYSPRRYGKTSLVLEAFSQITDIQTIYIDLFGSVNEQEFLHSYLDTLSRKLLNWQSGMKTITSVLRSIFRSATPSVTFDMMGNPSISLNVDPATNTQAAKEILNFPESISYRKPICIALDEFQEIDTLNPKLINVMRSVFQHQTNVFYLFLGSKDSLMTKIFAHPRSPFYQFGKKISLPKISHEAFHQFIIEQFRKTQKPIDASTVKDILDVTDGHPYYTQFAASVVWDIINSNEFASPLPEKIWLDKLVTSQSAVFQTLFDQLPMNQRMILSFLADESADKSLYSTSTRQHYSLPASSTVATAVKGLIEKGLLLKNGKTTFENPFFKVWVNSIRKHRIQP